MSPFAPNSKAPIQFTVGMPTYNDFNGVWLTIQALRLYFPQWLGEIIVIDNNPTSDEGTMTRDFCNSVPGARYVAFPEPKGPALAKGEVFKQARFDHVVCMDSHVMLFPPAFKALADFYASHPKSPDLIHGPMVNDNLVSLATHFTDEWPVDDVIDPTTKQKVRKPSQMWGRWGRDLKAFPLMKWEETTETEERMDPETMQVYLVPRHYPELPRPTVQWFEIGAQGMGLFACRKESFVGFNPLFQGFGGEEWYIHEKTRKAGNKVWCVSGFLWSHRFGRPSGSPAPATLWQKYRNYELGHKELGIDPVRLREHFIGYGLIPANWTEAAVRGDLKPPGETVIVDPAAPKPEVDDLVMEEEWDEECGCHKKKAGGKAQPKADAPLADGDTLEIEFIRVCETPGDINEHLPTLRKLVETIGPEAQVVELGTRYGVSTTALLAGQPAGLVSYDLAQTLQARKLAKYAAAFAKKTKLELRSEDSTACTPRPHDLLLVDTDPHTRDRVWAELSLHAPHCRRFIVFHDTEIFGEKYGDKPGVMPAVRRWLKEHPEWTMIRRDRNNNGLTVISRDDRDKTAPPNIARQALGFFRAVVRHAANGAAPTSEGEYNRRIELCLVCPQRFADVCGKCGCPVQKKASWAAEECPIGTWKTNEDGNPVQKQ
jgi:predicted O-methyltransferase YrrM